MKDISNQLLCAYCLRNKTHGGECLAEDRRVLVNGCLVFERDPLGCIRQKQLALEIELNQYLQCGEWYNYWKIGGIESKVRIDKMKVLKWEQKKPYIICDCSYYVNEFHEDYKEDMVKPNLKIVK